ncbi:MAG: malectin domain-containing carbohydrate-binding protein [Actinomycetota bacterium]
MTPRFPRRRLALLTVVALTAGMLVTGAGAGHAFQISQSQVVSADPVNWTPQIPNGKVEAIVQVGNRMIVAGTFTQAQNAGSTTTVTRNRILAFNATTGVIDTAFNPNANGEITSMVVAPGGTEVIIAGSFTSVGGSAATRIAKLDAVTGARVPGFSASAASGVNDMALWGNKVILGGNFGKINNVTRVKLASIDAGTGALDPNLNLAVTGLFNGGSTNIQKLDVSPDNTKLIIIGNFTAVAGQSRVQIAMINLSAGPATVANWQTNDFSGACASVFNTYMRDVEFSPDGSYFVPVSTGAGYFPTTLCDTATRWETSATGTDLHPTWIDYSGGDTYTAVAITGTTIYVGGHMRWLNNDIVGDVPAAGAVSREGIGALDPQNGMPLRWNPTRARGVGVFAFLATPAGLWVGHDTKTMGHETHNRIGMFPLAGGTTPPVGVNSTLPGTLYNLPPTQCSAGATPYLYRVNTGGPTIAANDCGPDWSGDPDFDNPTLRNSGSNTADWGSNGSQNGTVPATTPSGVFATERWDPSDDPEMQWTFAVPNGTVVQVRLYFINQYDGTGQVGQRVFNVSIDGTTVLPNFDIVATAGGDKTGEMRSFNITSDGTVNIDFGHIVENPLINAIEIVNPALLPGPQPIAANFLSRRSFDGTTLGGGSTFNTPTTDWSQGRGAFLLNGRIYAGWSDGRLYRWTFNGTTLGPRVDISAAGNYVLGPTWLSFSDVSGMFWNDGKLYYTRSGDPDLHFRYFILESELVGSNEYSVSGPGIDGLDWSGVEGMTQASGHMYWQTGDGVLHEIDFSSGAPVGGTDSVVGSIGSEGSNGLFVLPT